MLCLQIFSGCKSRQLNQDLIAAADNNLAEEKWNDVDKQVEGSVEFVLNDTLQKWNNCATLRVDTLGNPFPVLFTLDFGETECLCKDGKMRKGSIIYELSGIYRKVGTVITVSTDDYFVDDYKVIGTRSTTNLGKDSNDFLTFDVVVNEAQIITPDGSTITWSCQRTRTWIAGFETAYFTKDTINGGVLGWSGIQDDIHEITGFSSGTTQDGRYFDAKITSALRLDLGCQWITSGTVELTPDQLLTRTLDYGDGACDDEATVNIGRKITTSPYTNSIENQPDSH